MAAMANGPEPGPIIRVSNVRKTFREGASRTDALKDVSFEIMPGEFCTIIGRSGSGKSTLLNMLAGLDHPTRGQIVILGRHIERMSEDELVAFRLKHVGFVFQSYNLFPSYDALDNVAMPLTYRGVPRRVREKRARRMIQSVGLKHRMHHTPNKMSGGEQQRVGIARALITNPQIIFADEPTGNLDVKTSARALKLMVDCVRERGATLIVVTHDPEMSRYADHVIRLLDGCVIENSLNPNPDVIQPPEDSGQDWEPVAAPRKQAPPRHQGWLARRRAAKQAASNAKASSDPPAEQDGISAEAATPDKGVKAEQIGNGIGAEANTQVKPSEQDGDNTKAATPDKGTEAEQIGDGVGAEANTQVKPSEQDGDSTETATPDKGVKAEQIGNGGVAEANTQVKPSEQDGDNTKAATPDKGTEAEQIGNGGVAEANTQVKPSEQDGDNTKAATSDKGVKAEQIGNGGGAEASAQVKPSEQDDDNTKAATPDKVTEAEQSNDCTGTEASAQVKPSEQDGDSTKAATQDKNATPKQSEHSAVTAGPADSASTVLAPQGAGPADANAPYADVRAGQTDAARPAESPDDAARAGR